MDLSEAKSRVFSAARPAIHHKLNTYAKHVHVEVRNASKDEAREVSLSSSLIEKKANSLARNSILASSFFFLSFFLEEI